MKRISLSACLVAALTLSSFASGALVGSYVGIGAGKDQVRTPDKYGFNVSADPQGSTSRSLKGVGYRAFAGYNFNPFFGLEAGYTKYARSIYIGRALGAYSSLSYYFHTYDIVAKGYFPLGDSGFNIYGLLGGARVVDTMNYVNGGVPLSGSFVFPNSGSSHVWRNRPIYGLGINYSFMKHITLNLEATRIDRFGNPATKSTAVPYLDLYTLNVAYNFGPAL